MSKPPRRRPPRLSRVFANYQPGLFFITICTRYRHPILARTQIHDVFHAFGNHLADRHCAIGRYAIMPDHVHFLARTGSGEFSLSQAVRLLKPKPTFAPGRLDQQGPYWPPGFSIICCATRKVMHRSGNT